MRIKSFEIHNYRSLKNIKIDDFDTTTIFYGTNNAGKSNILNALELIFKRKQKAYEGNLTQAENFYEGSIPDSKTNYYNNDTLVPITFTISIEVGYKELDVSEIIAPIFAPDLDYTFIFEGDISFIEGTGDYSEIKFEKIIARDVVIYSNAEGKVEYFPSLGLPAKDAGNLSQAFVQLINIFNGCVYIIGSDRDMLEVPIDGEEVDTITPKTFKKLLYSLYLSGPNFSLFEEINDVFSQAPFEYGTISFSQEANKNLQLMIKEKNFRLPIKHLGSGVLQSLYIITSIIYSKSKIVCIEELEQNLSPRNQYEILKKIQSMITDDARSLNQIVISSHSAVYAKPKLGVIYFLEKNDGQTIIKSHIQKVIRGASVLSKELITHIAPVSPIWTPEDFDKYMVSEHDWVPFGKETPNTL